MMHNQIHVTQIQILLFCTQNNKYYYPYRAFSDQNKIVYSTRFVRRAIFFLIARPLCDQSFNIDLRLRYVVRIHSSENRTMPRPPKLLLLRPTSFRFRAMTKWQSPTIVR